MEQDKKYVLQVEYISIDVPFINEQRANSTTEKINKILSEFKYENIVSVTNDYKDYKGRELLVTILYKKEK